MYRLPGRKPAAVRADVAKLSRLAATYVRASDAYQIDEAELQPLGGTRRSSVLKAPPCLGGPPFFLFFYNSSYVEPKFRLVNDRSDFQSEVLKSQSRAMYAGKRPAYAAGIVPDF